MILDDLSPKSHSGRLPVSLDEGNSFERTTREIAISESDYFAIMQWDDEGGNPVDISYIILPNEMQ